MLVLVLVLVVVLNLNLQQYLSQGIVLDKSLRAGWRPNQKPVNFLSAEKGPFFSARNIPPPTRVCTSKMYLKSEAYTRKQVSKKYRFKRKLFASSWEQSLAVSCLVLCVVFFCGVVLGLGVVISRRRRGFSSFFFFFFRSFVVFFVCFCFCGLSLCSGR